MRQLKARFLLLIFFGFPKFPLSSCCFLFLSTIWGAIAEGLALFMFSPLSFFKLPCCTCSLLVLSPQFLSVAWQFLRSTLSCNDVFSSDRTLGLTDECAFGLQGLDRFNLLENQCIRVLKLLPEDNL